MGLLAKLKNKVNWKKGSSELVSMAIVLPIIFMLIFSVIGIIQIGLVRADAGVHCLSQRKSGSRLRNAGRGQG